MFVTKIGGEKVLIKKPQNLNKIMENKKWMDENFSSLDYYGIIYKGVEIFPQRDKKGNIKRKIVNGIDSGICKSFKAIYKYKDIVYEESSRPRYKYNENGSIVFMGDNYDLIGIDIDNKGDTLRRYEKWCEENGHDRETLIIQTANGGYHEYYRVTEEQKIYLKKCTAYTGTIYKGFESIDVKYNNQILFGPGCFYDDEENEYSYWIYYDTEPAVLPDFLYKPIYEKELEKDCKKINDIKYEIKNEKPKDQENKIEYEKVKKLIEILSIERADKFESWINVGFSLYNMNNNYLDIFIEFSKKSEKFDENEIRKKWNEFKKYEGGYTFGSIDYWARNDNPKKYIEIMEEYWSQYNYFSELDSEIALIFYNMYKEIIKYCGKWYIYEKGIWKKDNEGLKIKKIVTTNLMDFYKKKVLMYEKVLKESNEENKKETEEKIKLLRNIVNKLGTESKVNGIINMSKSNFNDEKFSENLDTNIEIICFGENVYDLKQNIWRETLPTDNCSLKCGVSKNEITDENKNIVMNILKDIFLNTEVLEYQLNNLAMMLLGGNKTQDFYIWQGAGANGKSLLTKYLDYIFGDYYINLPTNLITQKEGKQGSANSELVKMKSKRVCVFSEPQQNEKLNNSTIKMMTGGDKITAREIYSLPITFKIDAKMIILCNYTFSMEDVCDESMPRRINFIPFESRFKLEPNSNIPYEKQRNDEYMTDSFVNIVKGSFMKILIDRYRDLSKVGYKYNIPKNVKEAKQQFIDDNDMVKTFYNETYEISENKKDMILLKDMYEEYKRYCVTKKIKADKLKLFKDRVIIITPNFKEKYCYTEEGETINIRSVIIGLKYMVID